MKIFDSLTNGHLTEFIIILDILKKILLFVAFHVTFQKGVDQKKKISAKETQDLILGRSDNIHEAVVKSQEAGVAFNLMIEVRNKLVESYKELMRMQV